MPSISTVVPRVQRQNLIVVGNATAGKSALVQVLTAGVGSFPRNYSMVIVMTLGVEVHSKTMPLSSSSALELIILDCAGHSLYADIIEKCWPEQSLVCVVFDLTEPTALVSVAQWIERLQYVRATQYQGLLIGNKCDLQQRRAVSELEAASLAQQHRLIYVECSAKNNVNVFDAIKALVSQFVKENH